MSVGPGGTHDIRLASSEAASPATTVDLLLAQGEGGVKRWAEFRIPSFPPRQSEGAISSAQKDPVSALVFEMTDFSGGGYAPTAEPGGRGYALAAGVDARLGSAGLGPLIDGMDSFLIGDGGAERQGSWVMGAGITYGTTSGATSNSRVSSQTQVTSTYQLTSDGSRVVGDIIMSQALANPTVYRSREITVGALLRVGRLEVFQTGPGTTTSSATVSASALTFVSVTLTVDATTTAITVRFTVQANETAVTNYHIDAIYVEPTGGSQCRGTAELAGNLYGIFGRVIAQWNATDLRWNAVYIHASVIATDIIQWGDETNNDIYVAFGGDGTYTTGVDNYVYGGRSATPTTWTQYTGSTTDIDDQRYAIRFAKYRNQLVKSESNNIIRAALNPQAAGSNPWGSLTDGSAGSYQVGDSDREINRMYSAFDTVIVGKEDGLWVYWGRGSDGAVVDRFQNITQELTATPSATNFAFGFLWKGWLYLTYSTRGLIRFDGRGIEDLSSLFHPTRLNRLSFGGLSSTLGAIRGIAGDAYQLWLLIDTTDASTGVNKGVLVHSLYQTPDQTWRLHPIISLRFGTPDWLFISGNFMYALGRYRPDGSGTDTASTFRISLPPSALSMLVEDSPQIARSGFLVLPVWHADVIEDPKALLSFTIWCSSLDANHTIAVIYSLDGAPPDSSGTTLTTFSGTGSIQTAYFNAVTTPETNAVAQTVHIRLQFVSNNNTSPILHGFALVAALRARKRRAWEMFIEVGDGVALKTGQPDPLSKATILSRINTLEDQTYPIWLTHDLDGDGANSSFRVFITDLARVPTPGEEERGVETYKLTLHEAHTVA